MNNIKIPFGIVMLLKIGCAILMRNDQICRKKAKKR